MASKHVAPAVTLKSFSCPICGAHADQEWFRLMALPVGHENGLPFLVTQTLIDNVQGEANKTTGNARSSYDGMIERFKQEARGIPHLVRDVQDRRSSTDVRNLHASKCYSCNEVTFWKYDTILYPPSRYEVEPGEGMSEDVAKDFNEAREVLNLSPRSAAALLRLCIQKMCVELGEKGDNLSKDIGALVQKGLHPKVAQALDTVRVIGNNAVHPGELDLRDDRETAGKLFHLVNRIAYDMIAHPAQVEALYANMVPEGAKQAIAKRDGKE